MKKYTFICEFQGGTYISQYTAQLLTDALIMWANNLDHKSFTEKNIIKIINKIKESDNEMISIDGIDNVWCNSYIINRSLLLLNIVETV